MNISIIKTCTGCFACKAVCPQNCIMTYKDNIGHKHPFVNIDNCINCGKCLNTCPENNPVDTHDNLGVFAAWAKNEEEREASSSGGLAAAISKRMILKGGIVYGAAFVSPFMVKHVRCTNIEDIMKLKGSKYVQSDTSECWHLLKKDIIEGKDVLFIGTPCQTAAAQRLVKDRNRLIVVDLICHGVPSLDLLKDSIPKDAFQENISKMEFRKNIRYHFSLKKDSHTIFERSLNKDWYMKAFFAAIDFRESCYQCRYAQDRRTTDITIGDFWGYRRNNLDEKKGVSLAIINTAEGMKLFDSLDDLLNMDEHDIEEAKKENSQLNSPVHNHKIRRKIFSFLYPHVGFNNAFICTMPEVYLKNKIMR